MNRAGNVFKRDWVTCPMCGEPDMPREWIQDADDGPYITCLNLRCPSNGGPVKKGTTVITRRESFYARVILILALIAFTAVMVIYGHWIWGTIGFVMAIIASLSPIKSDEPDPNEEPQANDNQA